MQEQRVQSLEQALYSWRQARTPHTGLPELVPTPGDEATYSLSVAGAASATAGAVSTCLPVHRLLAAAGAGAT